MSKDIEIFNNIPDELKSLKCWELWRLEPNPKKPKPDKIPYKTTGKLASSTNPEHWSFFDEVCKAHKTGNYTGIGFVFEKSNGITGVDIDNCVKNGVILPEVQKIIEEFASYTEFSQSGNGIHILVKGNKPGDKCKKQLQDYDIEIYDNARYFALTGNVIPGFTELQERQEQLNEFYNQVFAAPKATQRTLQTGLDVLTRMQKAKNWPKIAPLWAGDTSHHGSPSEADLALCSHLAYYTRDAGEIDRYFRQSNLFRPKWDEKHGAKTYGQMTIEKAITSTTQHNKPTIPPPTTIEKYIRVGVNYYKVIIKVDRYGITRIELKPWKKEEIKQDYGADILKTIPKYDDFVLVPNNVHYNAVVNGCYNRYNKFPHTPAPGEWPWTQRLLEHIFGDQYQLGLRYMQILYLHPDRMAPILALVSKERQTGKTTTVNWFDMLFGANLTIIGSADIANGFNSYATANIVVIEETLIEKQLSVEKLKSLATAKTVTVNEKFMQQYKLPFFGKIILTSNNEDRFARIDQEEIRFWVRKLGKPEFTNHNIECDLLNEIPAFLHYLTTLPPVDFSTDRTGFTPFELNNKALQALKEESKSGLYHDLFGEFSEFFGNDTNRDEIECSIKDIKDRWFGHDNSVNFRYLKHVLTQEFFLKTQCLKRYEPFGNPAVTKVGRPYLFTRSMFEITDNEPNNSNNNGLPL